MRIAIVGGGWSGVSAAVRLAEAGAKVTLFERSRFLGGRSSSFWDASFGEWLDIGSHVFIRAYSASLALLRRWGSLDAVDFQRGRRIEWIGESGKRCVLDLGRAFPGPLPGFLRFDGLTLRGKWETLSGFRRIRSAASSGLTVAEVLDAAGMKDQDARHFFRALTLAVMNAPPEVAAAAPLAQALNEVLGGGSAGGALGVAKRSFYEFFSEPAASHLTRVGVDLRTGVTVRGVDFAFNRLAIRIPEDAGDFDAVILALPPHDLARLLSPQLQFDIFQGNTPEFRCRPIAGIHLLFEKPVLTSAVAFLPVKGGIWAFGRGEAEAGGWSRVSLSLSDAPLHSETPASELMEEVVRGLRQMFPAMTGCALLQSRIIRTVRATVELSPEVLGRRASCRTAIRGLYLAGDWTATGLPATIESAARSGRAAAEAAIEDLQRDRN